METKAQKWGENKARAVQFRLRLSYDNGSEPAVITVEKLTST
jgi:hypothetical protein